MFWRGFVFNFPLSECQKDDLAWFGKQVTCEGEVIGEIVKVTDDLEGGMRKIFVQLHAGASLPVRGDEDLEVSIGCQS